MSKLSKICHKEFVALSWKLLEAKVKYYLYPDMINISDAQYDILEQRYLELCVILHKTNTIQSMIGLDQTRPSVQLAMYKVLLN